jgi:hypothetical protein
LPFEYPPELLCSGRPPDQVFDPEELLYYRVTAFDHQGKVNVDEIRCPDTSVNRGKCSRPEHVLCPSFPKFVGCKVAQFSVAEVPHQLSTGDARTISFKVEHDPICQPTSLEENYSHCEIRAFEANARAKRVSEAVNKQYRMKLRNVMKPAPLPARAIE